MSGRQVNAERLEAIRALAANGRTVVEIAAHLGLTYNTVNAFCWRHKITVARSRVSSGNPRQPYGAIKKAVCAGLDSGLSVRQMADANGMPVRAVYNAVYRLRAPA